MMMMMMMTCKVLVNIWQSDNALSTYHIALQDFTICLLPGVNSTLYHIAVKADLLSNAVYRCINKPIQGFPSWFSNEGPRDSLMWS